MAIRDERRRDLGRRGRWGTFEGIQGQLAEYHESNYESNQDKLDLLFWCFRLACVLLVGETVAWIIDLSG